MAGQPETWRKLRSSKATVTVPITDDEMPARRRVPGQPLGLSERISLSAVLLVRPTASSKKL